MSAYFVIMILGVIFFFLLFAVQFYIAVEYKIYMRAGRTALLWTSIYIFFLFILRLIFGLNPASLQMLQMVSALTTLVPLTVVSVKTYQVRKELKKFNS